MHVGRETAAIHQDASLACRKNESLRKVAAALSAEVETTVRQLLGILQQAKADKRMLEHELEEVIGALEAVIKKLEKLSLDYEHL